MRDTADGPIRPKKTPPKQGPRGRAPADGPTRGETGVETRRSTAAANNIGYPEADNAIQLKRVQAILGTPQTGKWSDVDASAHASYQRKAGAEPTLVRQFEDASLSNLHPTIAAQVYGDNTRSVMDELDAQFEQLAQIDGATAARKREELFQMLQSFGQRLFDGDM